MQPTVRAEVGPFLIDSTQGWSVAVEAWQPLAFVELDRCDESLFLQALPPVPVIGIGERGHPRADRVDAIIEPPIDAATLIQQVQRAPRAAAVIVQLLRALQGVPLEAALWLESFAYGLLQGSEEHAAWLSSRGTSPRRPPGRVIVERHAAVLLPGAGGCVSISRRVGRQRAALMMLSGQRIDAGTALRWGLIDAIA